MSFCTACAAPLDATGRHPVCTGCGRVHFRDPKVGVGVVVLDDAGRLLLVRRGVGPGKGLWALPAGFVDADEDPRAAAAREAQEETGLEVEVGAVVDVYASPGRGGASFFLAFEARVVGGVLSAADDALDAAFFRADELPELAFPSTRDAAARVRPSAARPRPGPADPVRPWAARPGHPDPDLADPVPPSAAAHLGGAVPGTGVADPD